MPRSIIALIIVVVVVLALLFGLSRLAHEKPLKHVEKVVPLANLQK
jgi:fumarate reductase subunit D